MISFIIPVYNKASVLRKMLSSLQNHLQKHNLLNYEMIVVNDGSTDSSFNQAVLFKQLYNNDPRIKIYHYTKNVGKGFALQFGFTKSTGDPIVFLDGDMDIDTKQIIKALEKFNQTQSDMAIGSKYLPQSRIHYPLVRFLYSKILQKINHQLFHLSVTDTQVGLKVFRREVLLQVFPRLVIKRFAMDLELLVVAHLLGFTRIIEIHIVIKHTNASRSSIDIVAVKNFCLDVLAIWYRKNLLKYYDRNVGSAITPSFSIQTA